MGLLLPTSLMLPPVMLWSYEAQERKGWYQGSSYIQPLSAILCKSAHCNGECTSSRKGLIPVLVISIATINACIARSRTYKICYFVYNTDGTVGQGRDRRDQSNASFFANQPRKSLQSPAASCVNVITSTLNHLHTDCGRKEHIGRLTKSYCFFHHSTFQEEST